MEQTTVAEDTRYEQALASVAHAINKFEGCSPEEKKRLQRDLEQLRAMESKLLGGRVEIIVFGEISTGKSALINALVGRHVAEVNVRGGWTREVWNIAWDTAGYRIPGLKESQLVLVDTPGLNEVGGDDRAKLSRDVAQHADLILFVTDSDLNEIEYSALVALAASNKPIILVLNKIDLYSSGERQELLQVLQERLERVVTPDNIVLTAADPREVEYVTEDSAGHASSQWRRPEPDVAQLKQRILEVLERDGLALLALNAAMYAADKSDRIAKLRVELRNGQANQTIWSFAGFKALAVALNPAFALDVLGGTAVDISMVVTLAHIYGLELSWTNARRLISSIVQSAGWVMLGEWTMNWASSVFKLATLGYGTVLTAVPQGAAAGFGSYIVGQAAKYYFEHGASWGGEGPKTVVRRILDQTDKDSVLQHLKQEIRQKIQRNLHVER
jgi:small GTP-binding protein